MPLQSTSKACTRCKRFLPAAEFAKCVLTKSGLQPWCRACMREQARQYRRLNVATIERRMAARLFCKWRDDPKFWDIVADIRLRSIAPAHSSEVA
jgi:hypothetical protein